MKFANVSQFIQIHSRIVPKFRLKLLPQKFSTAMNSRLYRGYWHVQDIANFLQGHIMQIPQHHNRSVFIRQGLDRITNILLGFRKN
jgi:hypothetical protein